MAETLIYSGVRLAAGEKEQRNHDTEKRKARLRDQSLYLVLISGHCVSDIFQDRMTGWALCREEKKMSRAAVADTF